MDGFSQTVAGIRRGNTSGPATIKNSSATQSILTVTNTASYTFDSLIEGNLVLIKRGFGTLTLSGTNTYSNGTTIAEGTLVLSAANAGGAGHLTVANGATCTVTSASSAIADTATVSLGASGVMSLDDGVAETVRCLYINGVQQGAGVWNATRDPVRFSGNGSLVVLVGNATRISFF
jgi:autotransporter-associated beta strand protein